MPEISTMKRAAMRGLVVASLLLACAGPLAAQTKKGCDFPNGWWEGRGLMPLFVGPPGAVPSTDCDFQLWSWTAFVHWIQNDPKTGQPLFLQLPTYDDLTSGIAARMRVGPRTLALKPRTQKPKAMSSVQQASGGVLVDQHGRAVYYATHMDPIYFAFTSKYFGAVNYSKAPPTLPYPLGATVLKTSWRIVQPGEDTSKVFTITATIDLLESDGNGGVKPNGQTQSGVTVALVGMHVVGVINQHPEFAWGTFEQADNAPDLPDGMQPSSPAPVSSQNFTFYQANTPANQCNSTGNLTIVPNTQVISPVTNVFRQFAYGGATPASRVADITSSNQNFQGAITEGKSKAVNPVFANYRLIGTVWILAKTLQPGDGNMWSEAIGSIDLANSTLETFVQGPNSNCFGCHNTSGGNGYPGKDINLSHIIIGVLPVNPAFRNAYP